MSVDRSVSTSSDSEVSRAPDVRESKKEKKKKRPVPRRAYRRKLDRLKIIANNKRDTSSRLRRRIKIARSSAARLSVEWPLDEGLWLLFFSPPPREK